MSTIRIPDENMKFKTIRIIDLREDALYQKDYQMSKYRIIKKAVAYSQIHNEYSFEYSPEVLVGEGLETNWLTIAFTNKVYGSKQSYSTQQEAIDIINSHKIQINIDAHPLEMIYID